MKETSWDETQVTFICLVLGREVMFFSCPGLVKSPTLKTSGEYLYILSRFLKQIQESQQGYDTYCYSYCSLCA